MDSQPSLSYCLPFGETSQDIHRDEKISPPQTGMRSKKLTKLLPIPGIRLIALMAIIQHIIAYYLTESQWLQDLDIKII